MALFKQLIALPNQTENIASFDYVRVKKNCEKVGYRYPKDAVLTNFSENNYLDQYRDLKLSYKEYVGENLMNRFITYINMKNNYPIQALDIRYQVDHKTPKENQLFEVFNIDPDNVNARLFFVLVRHRQIEMVSDGNKFIEKKVL